MRFRLLLASMALGLIVSVVEAQDLPVIRKIELKDVKLKPAAAFSAPLVIESANALAAAKVFEDDAGRELVKKQIDFKKEKLVVCTWVGGSGAMLDTDLEKDRELGWKVLLTHQPSAKKDKQQYDFAFAVPKDLRLKVVMK